MVDQARDAAFEQIAPHEAHRVFYKLPTHRKVIIMFGGPFMNLVIAAVPAHRHRLRHRCPDGDRHRRGGFHQHA